MGETDRRAGIYIDRDDRWKAELQALRMILLDSPLDEAFKWRQPVYVFRGTNLALLGRFKDCCALSFFKGVLYRDPSGLLVPPGDNSRSARVARFTTPAEIRAREPDIRAQIAEAIAAEEAGLKVDLPKDDIAYPDELAEKMAEDPDFAAAFEALTPGRRRGWALQFAQPKQAATRAARIEKAAQSIREGKGPHDR